MRRGLTGGFWWWLVACVILVTAGRGCAVRREKGLCWAAMGENAAGFGTVTGGKG